MITAVTYADGVISSKRITEASDISSAEKVWIDVHDFDEAEMAMLKEEFGLHSLTIEDSVRARTRVKIEEYRHYTYIVLRGVILKRNKKHSFEQINVIVGSNFLLTISHKKRKSTAKLMNNHKQLIRLFEKGAGLEFIAHALIDDEVDRYFPYLQRIDNEIDDFEEEVFDKDSRSVVQDLFDVKKEVVMVRRIISSSLSVVRTLSSRETKFFDPDAMIYFRDVYDHLISLAEIIDVYRDLITNTLEIQLSISSNRLNDIMRTLTIITTLLMPLTFITGLYGMNFQFMPELEWQYGYPVVILVMIVIEVLMLLFFRRKKWI